jgi:phage shock protein PspC (stress-responsive transcriptional regulator)
MVTHTRLRRRTEQRLIAGVAGGIAHRLNASAGFVRVFLAIASFWALDWVLAIYAIAALVIPPRDADRPDWDNLIGLTRLAVLIAVPVFGDRAGMVVNEPLQGPAGWWIAYYGLLAAGAVALLTADYRRERPRTRNEARAVVLGAAPVAACFAALGAAMLLAPDVRWERYLPIASLVAAAALLVATRRRSAAAFLAPALLAMGMVGVAMAADARLQGGLGDQRLRPTATAAPTSSRAGRSGTCHWTSRGSRAVATMPWWTPQWAWAR